MTTTRHLFGTDGIRGRAGVEPMTPELLLRLGRAIAYVASRDRGRAPRIIIGKDTRLSGYMLEQAIAAGICAMGGRVMLTGPMPTPAVANLTQSMRADAGIVSREHNPSPTTASKLSHASSYPIGRAAIEALRKTRAVSGESSSAWAARKAGKAFGRYVGTRRTRSLGMPLRA